MPTIKPKRASVQKAFQGFSGIGNSKNAKKLGCSELQNFRILSDGTLEKRCGFTKLKSLPGRIRGYWEGVIDGMEHCFAVVGNTVYQEVGVFFLQRATVLSVEGKADFVLYRNTLYLLDGKSIYCYRPATQTFEAAKGYVPLIGLSWSPSMLGEWNEAINLFSDHVHISYSNAEGSTTYRLPFFAKSIDFVQADGQPVTDFVLAADSRSFTVPRVYSWLEVGFTLYSADDAYARIKTAKQFFCDRINDKERLFLYGCESGNDLFGCAEVSKSMMTSCRAHYPNADPLYFTDDMRLAVGSEEMPLTTLYQNRGRLLGFHANGAVSIQIGSNTEVATSYSLLHGYGCTAKLPPIAWNERLVIVNRAGIFLLSSRASDPDDFELTVISEGIDAFAQESFFQNATVCYDAEHEELWFYDQTNALTIWVYHLRLGVWYTFTGISPDACFIHEGSLAFVRNSVIYVFDETANTDSGREIYAKMKSEFLFADLPERVKRSLRATLLVSTDSDTLSLRLISENQSQELQIPPGKSTLPFLFDARAALGRFHILQAELTATGTDRPRIYRIALFANS